MYCVVFIGVYCTYYVEFSTERFSSVLNCKIKERVGSQNAHSYTYHSLIFKYLTQMTFCKLM